MIVWWSSVLILASAIGSLLVAGVLFAFSSFVMAGFSRLPAEQGMLAMQSINVTVITPSFMLPFFGTAAICVVLVATSYSRWGASSEALLLGGCFLYLAGCMGVTVFGNVPLNDALAAADPKATEGRAFWEQFIGEWTIWNHVRTTASLLAGILFLAVSTLRTRL